MVPIATELTQAPSAPLTVANGYPLNNPPFLAVPETIIGQPYTPLRSYHPNLPHMAALLAKWIGIYQRSLQGQLAHLQRVRSSNRPRCSSTPQTSGATTAPNYPQRFKISKRIYIRRQQMSNIKDLPGVRSPPVLANGRLSDLAVESTEK